MQIIYFQFKGFHMPFITMKGIDFKFYAKIMRRSSVCCSSCIRFNPTSHLNHIFHIGHAAVAYFNVVFIKKLVKFVVLSKLLINYF